MMDRILIANRGEIAVRIIRCCRRMGLAAIAVYSDADRDAVHVRMADDAAHIGPPEAVKSYLDMGAIIDAARRTGATAVHPGYGFLAENPVFAARCRDADLVFIGPSIDVIREMGSKTNAKQAAHAAGVPVIPGSTGADENDAALRASAEAIGMPIMIKASAGGGGRGMRRVESMRDFDVSIRLARAEARTSFGDPAVFIERALITPRHVEIQILGDQHGNVLHLFDRDCSIQRLNQKIIEEAPAPFLPDTLRTVLAKHAVHLGQAIGYDSAGTVEFLFDPETNEAFFLEMNTRLQVEHTVTEMITGIDLVEWQIRTALGEPLTLNQSDIEATGCAVEARVAAENPAIGFTPTTGTVGTYVEPVHEGIRIDSGIDSGTVIGPYYDSLLLKVIAHGPDRTTAARRLDRALGAVEISGLETNIPFLAALAAHPEFEAGRLDTGFLDRAYPDGWIPPDDDRTLVRLAAIAYTLTRAARRAPSAPSSPWHTLGGWRVTAAAGFPGRTCLSLMDDQGVITDLSITEHGGTIIATDDDGTPLEIGAARLDGDVLIHERAGRRFRDSLVIEGPEISIRACGSFCRFHVLPPEERYLARTRLNAPDTSALTAPMPGLVTEVYVGPGDHIEAGQPLLVLEAMKMLHTLSAPIRGTVGAVHCGPGDTVDGNTVLLEYNLEQQNGN
jgi:acetyl-CoA carboxylase biotin carboxylase subunit